MSTLIKTKYLIIGASYAGSILARKLYPYGHTLLVDKSIPGSLMNCGGGLPQKTFVKLKVTIPFIRIKKIIMDIHGKETSFPCKYVVIDRRKLNQALFDKTMAIGIRFARMSYVSHDPETKTASFMFKGDKAQVEYDKIIFADGLHPNRLRIPQKKLPEKIPHGVAKVQLIEGVPKYTDTLYFKITEDNPFGYSWIFPSPCGMLNVGAGSFHEGALPDSLINNLKEEFNLSGKVIARGGGVLPVMPVPKIQDSDTYLFGNAAGMVYALNGEGLKHIEDASDWFSKAIIKDSNLNFRWRCSSTYMKLRFASVTLKALLAGSKTFNKSLYPAACRMAARSRRLIKM